MTATPRAGVDVAIRIVTMLARRGKNLSTSAMLAELGIPKASFYRILGVLEKHGVVERSRGKVSAGPIARALAARMQVSADADSRYRSKALGAIKVNARPAGMNSRVPELSRPGKPLPRTRFKIGFSNGGLDNLWQVALVHSVEFAASRYHRHLEAIDIVQADGDAEKQRDDINRLISEGVDGLLVNAVEPRTLVETSERAAKQGIPLVFVERGGAEGVTYTSFVTSNNPAIGNITARWLTEQVNGRGTILMIYGRNESEAIQDRVNTAQLVFDGFPDIKTVRVDPTSFKRDLAYGEAYDAIGRHGEAIVGVWCDSGLNTVGSLQAYVDAGVGDGEIPPHTGGELNLSYKLAVGRHIQLGSFDYPPAMGMRAFEVLLSAVRGAWVPRHVDISSRFVTTRSPARSAVRPHTWADERVRWDMPDELVLGTGLGRSYNPYDFRVNYPGNIYNRSAALVESVP